MALDTDKQWIRELVSICSLNGVKHVVMSPGSRCAPLVIAFNRNPDIECTSIVDERSAAFFALGMAQQLQQPVALLCTSGTAVLNYAPAIAEAYYQKIPLIVITADRPLELIDQADGQTIRQNDIYHNYIKQSFQLPVEVTDGAGLTESNKTVLDAIQMCQHPDCGPVHINVPLREPLYGMKEYDDDDKPSIPKSKKPKVIVPKDLDQLVSAWSSSTSKMLVVGGYHYDAQLSENVTHLAEDKSLAIIAEITANLQGRNIINCPDALFSAANDMDIVMSPPTLLVTFGGSLVSKKLKVFLRNNPAKEHWHVSLEGAPVNTFQCLTKTVAMSPDDFIAALANGAKSTIGSYHKHWQQLHEINEQRHKQILQKSGYNDLKVFELLLSSLQKGSNIHLGNSTPIRYAGLFEPTPTVTYNSNRGTSGIDGVMSTAAGAAKANGKPTTVITGDVAFFYDSNALWNKHLPGNLRIIVVNNGGGNIFRVLKGSGEIPELEEFFETKMELRAEYLAKTFGIPYYFCKDLKGLKNTLPKFYETHDGKCAILEIKTPGVESAAAMRDYLGI